MSFLETIVYRNTWLGNTTIISLLGKYVERGLRLRGFDRAQY